LGSTYHTELLIIWQEYCAQVHALRTACALQVEKRPDCLQPTDAVHDWRVGGETLDNGGDDNLQETLGQNHRYIQSMHTLSRSCMVFPSANSMTFEMLRLMPSKWDRPGQMGMESRLMLTGQSTRRVLRRSFNSGRMCLPHAPISMRWSKSNATLPYGSQWENCHIKCCAGAWSV
jgi:hypothetical protein